jgi:hypothetical protein
LPYREGDPIPPGYQLVSEANTGLVVAGSLVLGGAYLGSVIYGASSTDNGGSWLFLPVFGPWGAMLNRKTPCSDDGAAVSVDDLNDMGQDCAKELVSEAQTIAILLVDGIVQAAGAGLLIGGLASSETFLVYESQTANVRVSPVAHPSGYALGLSGSF